MQEEIRSIEESQT
jgi:hypothetical protein